MSNSIKKLQWGSFPNWWVNDKDRDISIGNIFLGGKHVGESISGIKVLLCFSIKCNFWRREVKISLDEIEKITNMSRPTVIKGIKTLENNGIIGINREKKPSTYYFLKDETKNYVGFSKVPYKILISELSKIPNRGRVVLDALKIYLLLVSLRPNDSISLNMSHKKIVDIARIQTKNVRPAIDILINHFLIKVVLEDVEKEGRRNLFTITGI